MSYRALARADVSRREHRRIFQERHSAMTIRASTTLATDFPSQTPRRRSRDRTGRCNGAADCSALHRRTQVH